jgi:arylsulfatase A-like enzyme
VFSQHVTQLVAQGHDLATAKQALYDEVTTNFDAFLAARKPGQPFCFWFGPTQVHRSWVRGSGKALWGLNPDHLEGRMPPFLPDEPEVRQDLADYFGEIQSFDATLGRLLARLEAIGELDNTLVVVSGDHGAPGFPHGKCNLYDFGTAVPLGEPYRLDGSNPPTVEELTHDTRSTLPDEDAGPTKAWLVNARHDPRWKSYFDRAYGKRPREELYDLRQDPHQIRNVAQDPAYADIRSKLEARLLEELRRTGDPRLIDDGRFFETPPMAGPLADMELGSSKTPEELRCGPPPQRRPLQSQEAP